ncbi:hypothetical protein ACLM5J_09550 [Nocardioides sp. Bht2]|uniref:hypothetical protein n=1 Tax=Nocardioides sp. Bht2 TaxID=3392297 RepID=UPI0039B59093
MTEPIVLPPLSPGQQQSWHALMDLHEYIDSDWTLIGGQLVHLHCAERNVSPSRPTDDADTVVNIRTNPGMLATFTGALRVMAFQPDITGDGLQHRWRRELAQIDVLIPEGIGERAAARLGVGGAPTLSAPGTSQALSRTERVAVTTGGRTGHVLRPTLFAALVGKAAARTEIVRDPAQTRHCIDFVVLASLVAARDLRSVGLEKKDRLRLRKMLACCRSDAAAMEVADAGEALARLERAIELQLEPSSGANNPTP